MIDKAKVVPLDTLHIGLCLDCFKIGRRETRPEFEALLQNLIRSTSSSEISSFVRS